MPLYDYQCRTCSKISEVRHGFREVFEGACPACGSDEMSRVFNPAGIVFKGSGFYINDSRPKSTESSKSAESSKSGESSTSGESGSSTPAAPATPAASGTTAAPAAPASGGDSKPKKSESSAA